MLRLTLPALPAALATTGVPGVRGMLLHAAARRPRLWRREATRFRRSRATVPLFPRAVAVVVGGVHRRRVLGLFVLGRVLVAPIPPAATAAAAAAAAAATAAAGSSGPATAAAARVGQQRRRQRRRGD